MWPTTKFHMLIQLRNNEDNSRFHIVCAKNPDDLFETFRMSDLLDYEHDREEKRRADGDMHS